MDARKLKRRRSQALVVVATLAVGLVAPSVADAARPTQIGPRTGAVLAAGSQPTFKVRDSSRAARKYGVFITISTSKARKRNGDLRKTDIGTFAQMKRTRTTYRYRPLPYTFPTWFMVRPGKYYWQAYRIDCSSGNSSCHVQSRVRSFRVQ